MSDASAARATLEIVNRLGLHMRAARLFVQMAESFDADVAVAKDGQVVNGRSIMGVIMLAAEQGSTIEVSATGRQAEEAVEALRALVAARFNEPD